MGVQENLRISEEKCLFPPFSGFPRCSLHPLEKGEKSRKRAKKADFGRFPGRVARHPLSPHLLHPHLWQPNFYSWGINSQLHRTSVTQGWLAGIILCVI